MKRIIFITLLVVVALLLTAEYAPAQTEDPIVGKWYYAMNHKIDYNVMMDSASTFGFDTEVAINRVQLFASIAAIVISRCENSNVFFSPFENGVMLETKRYNDPTTTDVQWGKWKKLSEGTYLVEFKNRVETYQYNELTDEYFLIEREGNLSLTTKLLANNLKLVRKKGD